MTKAIKHPRIPPESLRLTPGELTRAMGYKDPADAPGMLTAQIPALIRQAPEHIRPFAAYRIFEPADVKLEKGLLHLHERKFLIKNIIWSQIRALETLAFFICSLGSSFDRWIKAFYDRNDDLSGYIADTIGSELVEKLADRLQDELQIEAQSLGMHISNRFSPGYCGWSVKEQHALFSFFLPESLRVRLTDAALMDPVKSVSGLTALGTRIEKKDYFCSICDAKDCYKRRQ